MTIERGAEKVFSAKTVDLIIFYVGELLCGIDISWVQEVNKHLDITTVHQAPDIVRGIVNLRGQIISIIDLRRCLGFPSQPIDAKTRSIVVRHQDEAVGLIVDDVDDIITTTRDAIYPPPPHLQGPLGDLFEGVYQLDHRLVSVLDVSRLWFADEQPSRSS